MQCYMINKEILILNRLQAELVFLTLCTISINQLIFFAKTFNHSMKLLTNSHKLFIFCLHDSRLVRHQDETELKHVPCVLNVQNICYKLLILSKLHKLSHSFKTLIDYCASFLFVFLSKIITHYLFSVPYLMKLVARLNQRQWNTR
jgi:hypothetical protein